MAVISVEKLTIALVVPDNATFIFDARATRLSTIEFDPVFPVKSVAMAVIVFVHPTRFEMTFDQVHQLSVALEPFTIILVTQILSDIVPEIVGEPVTVAPLACDVIAMTGAMVSAVLNVRIFDALFPFPARSREILAHTETSTVPVEIVGVREKVYHVELV